MGALAGTTELLTSGPQTASIAVGAGLVTILDYRILLLIISAVLIGCGAVLTVQCTQRQRSSTSEAYQAGTADGS